MKLLAYLSGIITRPNKTIGDFCRAPSRHKMGFIANSVACILAGSSMLPDSIRTESPDPWALAIITPMLLAVWLLPAICLSAFARIVGRKAKGRETITSVALQFSVLLIAFAVSVPLGDTGI